MTDSISKVNRCKGAQDLSPADMTRFRRVESAFREACLKWGYGEVRTPVLEYLHLFTSAGTLSPGMLHKVYSFLDWDGWSGERVVLRPDVTIPVARYFIDCLESREQAKLFYVANVFRFEETGQDARERWQCGAELIGAGSPAADAELTVVALDVLRRLGLDGLELRLSHAGLVRAALSRLGLSPSEQSKIIERNGSALAELSQESRNGNVGALLGIKGGRVAVLKNLKTLLAPAAPELVPALDNFIAVADLVDALGFPYRIDVDAGKGFEYYTGMVFQLYAGETRIGSGGRYDALIPVLGGQDIPASGFALYVDRIMTLLAPEAGRPAPNAVITAEPGLITNGFKLAMTLHEHGYAAGIGDAKSGARWLIEVRSSAPAFLLTDNADQNKYTANTSDEVAAVMGGQSAVKSRAA